MDLIIARFLHIFAGICWIGAGFTAVFVIEPYLRKMQQQGIQTANNIFSASNWARFMPIAAMTTLLAGLYLAYRLSGGFQRNWLSQNGMTVLAIGSIAGVLALIHGGAVLGRAQGKLAAFSAQIKGTPTAEQSQQLAAMSQEMRTHNMVSFVLALIAVVGMAIARYVS